jgi:cell division septal protein FtsQ
MNTRTRAIAISIVLFSLVTYLFAWSPIFEVRSVATEGLPREVSAASIVSKSKIEIGQKLSRIEPRSVERTLRELSWVKSVSVERKWWSGKVIVKITPRIAVGIYKNRAIDSSGTLFVLPGKTPPELPVVSASTPELGLEAIGLFTDLPPELRDNVISISAASENSISSWQHWGSQKLKVTWGTSREIDLKVTVLQALLQLPENKAIKRVDLSAPHAPIVK